MANIRYGQIKEKSNQLQIETCGNEGHMKRSTGDVEVNVIVLTCEEQIDMMRIASKIIELYTGREITKAEK